MTLLTLWTLLSIPVGVIVGLWLRACWGGVSERHGQNTPQADTHYFRPER